MRRLVILMLGIMAVTAYPKSQRIIGGSLTTIDQRPEMVALLHSYAVSGHSHMCGGSILNNRSILTAAHCIMNDVTHWWRSRVGSSYSNRGGVVYHTHKIISHPHFDMFTADNDVGIIRTSTEIIFNENTQPGRFAGSTYHVLDDEVVWVAGWGFTSLQGPQSEHLRHVQIWTVNQEICKERYTAIKKITRGMICAGWLDVGGRDACDTDSGGPLYHNGVVVGVVSFGKDCALPRYPGVYARVQHYSHWIQHHR